jgi:hypothetical protein
MRRRDRRIDADGRLSVFLRMQELPRALTPQAGRLLRFLLVRFDTLPTYSDNQQHRGLLLMADN